MKAKVYMRYYGPASEGSKEMKGYYAKDEDYVEALDKSLKEGDAVFGTVMAGELRARDEGTASFYGNNRDHPINEETEPIRYADCEVELFDIDGEKETVDGIITKFVSREMFAEVVVFDRTYVSGVFDEELNMWRIGGEKIEELDDDEYDEDWKTAHMPRRDLKLEFTNNAGETVYAELLSCMIADCNPEKSEYTLIIKELNLIDSI